MTKEKLTLLNSVFLHFFYMILQLIHVFINTYERQEESEHNKQYLYTDIPVLTGQQT